jgi:hypothetical protein
VPAFSFFSDTNGNYRKILNVLKKMALAGRIATCGVGSGAAAVIGMKMVGN